MEDQTDVTLKSGTTQKFDEDVGSKKSGLGC